jgi:hypothetical protein
VLGLRGVLRGARGVLLLLLLLVLLVVPAEHLVEEAVELRGREHRQPRHAQDREQHPRHSAGGGCERGGRRAGLPTSTGAYSAHLLSLPRCRYLLGRAT